MEELSLRMRFKRSIRVFVIFASAIIFAYDIIYFVGSRYYIDQSIQRPLRRKIYSPVNTGVAKETTQAYIEDICRSMPPDKYSDWIRNPDYIVAPDKNLSFCRMHNEMDDIWARIFELFINSSKISGYLNPPFPQIHKTGLMKDFDAVDREKFQTVLYVRNPYSRLYVLYHDRFHIVTAHSQHKKWCENITFQEFLDKVITHVKLRLDWGTSWAATLVPKCRICDVKVFSVIREENFIQDMQEFSHKLFETDKDYIKTIEFIQKQAIFIHSIVVAKLNFRNPTCKYSQFGSVLWRSLQYMGYVNSSVKYPDSLDKANVALHPDILVKAVLKAGNISLTENEKLVQRQVILAEAYRDIKEETIEYIQDIYKYEFEMFGYSKARPNL